MEKQTFFFLKASVFCLAIALIIPSGAVVSETFDVGQSDTSVSLSYSVDDLYFSNYGGYDVVELSEGNSVHIRGKPVIPFQRIHIALPQNTLVKSATAVHAEKITLPGSYELLPSQRPKPTNVLSEIESNMLVGDHTTETVAYSSLDAYPGEIVSFVYQTDLAGQAIAVVDVYPVQYISDRNTLQLYHSFDIKLETSEGYLCGDFLSQQSSSKDVETYESIVTSMVINPEDVSLQRYEDDTPQPFLPPGGPYDHVIIGDGIDESHWQPLVDWHTKRGLKDTYITVSYIDSNYAGANRKEKVRNFVKDAHASWGTMYFLIAGEHERVPFEYRTVYWDAGSTPSDQYYSDYDDDWTMEVFVGRVPAQGSTQVSTFVDKVLKYETNPPLSNYLLDALLIGMDANYETYLEMMKDDIDSNFIPNYFDVTKVYDSDSTNHKTKTIDALNDGQNLVNHADHASKTSLGLGSDGSLGISDVDNLVNDGKPCIFTTLGCDPNEMDYEDCIGEHFVIYNPDQAGVAFNGNTRHGYFYSGDNSPPYDLSIGIDYEWWESLFIRNKYILGETLADTKHNYAQPSDVSKHCEWTFNLQGGPAMPVWTEQPKSLTVTHPTTLPTGTSTFDVHVESSGTPVQDAYVCLWKTDEVYLTGYTDTTGDVTFNPSPSTEGVMYVTVTKHNYIPYRGQSQVEGDPDKPDAPTNPDPANGETNVQLSPTLSVDVSDPNGDSMDVTFYDASDDSVIGTDTNVASGSRASVDWSDANSYDATYSWYTIADDKTHGTTQSATWSFTTLAEPNDPPYAPTNPDPADGATGVDVDPTLSVDVSDPDGDSMDVTFYDASDDSVIGTDTNVASGSRASVVWSNRAYDTTYSWYTIADDGPGDTQSATWSFTTKPNTAPDTPMNPDPADGATDVPLSPMLSVDVNDPDGDAMTVSFYESDGTFIGDDTVTGSGTASAVYSNADQYTTEYFWYTVADDGTDSTTSPTWSFTTTELTSQQFTATADLPDLNGGITNDYTATHTTNNIYEAIKERGMYGVYADLAHKWTIDVDSGFSTYTFAVEAYHTPNSDGDDFRFSYSTDDVTYYDMFTVTKTSDNDAYQKYDLPDTLSGTVYIKVIDTDRQIWKPYQDTLYVDHMYIEGKAPNNPPDAPLNPVPADGAMGVSLSPTLSVDVSDSDGDSMDVTFYDASDDSVIGTDYNVPSGGTASTIWSDLSYQTTYDWYAIADDETDTTTSSTWSFTTEQTPPNNPPDAPNTPNPDDGATGVDTDPELSVLVTDPDGDSMDVTFYDASDDSVIGTDYNVLSGDRAYTIWSDLAYETTYNWYTKADDSINITLSETWSFTTKQQTSDLFYANADIPIDNGGITNDYTATHTSNNVYEAIKERGIWNVYADLTHKWTIDVSGGYDTYKFKLEAHHTTNTDGDDFIFSYSTDDSTYTDMVTVTKTSDDDTYYTYTIPSSLSGTIYIRVIDTDRALYKSYQDTLYVDHMYIEGK